MLFSSILLTFFAPAIIAAPITSNPRSGGPGPSGNSGRGGPGPSGNSGSGKGTSGTPGNVAITNPGGPIQNVTTPTSTANPGGPIQTALPTSFTAPGLSCPLTNAKIDVTDGSGLAVPSGAPKIVALGVGVQNYTCGSTGTWTSIGAVANLFDISCAVNTPLMNVSNAAATTLLKTLATKESPIVQHFFVTAPNNGTGVDPEFKQIKTGASSVLSKTASITSPQGSANVAWLQLTNIVGTLATSVYRVDTQLGQPPATCTPGTDTNVLSVDYSAKYWFY
ncbi:hypothetical protein DL93DRAFT_2227112 [Clavulina sp. PMI_390]|nr:hypothetical protein DL93DRAFT_2227112 [Clavulina sp. PMI_390]